MDKRETYWIQLVLIFILFSPDIGEFIKSSKIKHINV